MLSSLKRLILAAVSLLAVFSCKVAAAQMALPVMSVVCVRETPSHAGELGTQVLMGVPVEVIERRGEWFEVKTIDGYHGFVINHSLIPLTQNNFDRWRESDRLVYVGNRQTTVNSVDSSVDPVSDLVPGCIVELIEQKSDSAKVRLPDGRVGKVAVSDGFMPLGDWASQPFSAKRMIKYAKSNLGVPYLWGGTSSKSMDCSGLTWVAAWLNGRLLPRNASAQAKIGCKLSLKEDIRSGSLLFFGNRSNGKVNHVAIYEGNGSYLESSGRVKQTPLKIDNSSVGQGFLHAVDISALPPIRETLKTEWLFK